MDNSCVDSKSKLLISDVDKTLTDIFGVKIDKNNIELFEKEFDKTIYEQEEVKKQIVSSFKKNLRKIIFIGPNSVGKNKTAELVGKTLFNNHYTLIDCGDFNQQSLIQNYKDSENYRNFLYKIKENSNSLFVMDNLDKSGDEFIKNTLNSLKKGYFLEMNGNKLLCNNSTFIFIVSDNKKHYFSMENKKLEKRNSFQIAKDILGIEFVNEIDDIILFNEMNEIAYEKIVIDHLGLDNFENIHYDIKSKSAEMTKYGGASAVEYAKEIVKSL